MNSAQLVLSRRIRKTPFEQRVFENGVQGFTTYNHMPLASIFSSPQEDYEHLCENVQIWDVSCERQVEVVGPDAMRLVELVTPRDISLCEVGQCMYAPLVDETGSIVNDPIIIRLAEDRLWVSIADSGVLLWMRGIAYGRGFDVNIFEPDVSPLAVQGPKSNELMSDLLGDHVRDIKWFWFIETRLADTDVILARSGWSGQGGFEIYLQDESRGLALWDLIWEAGQKYDIRAGCPNLIDRIERGLLSYGSDMTLENNPYECGLDRFFESSKEAECMSKDAMEKILLGGVSRNHVYLVIDGDPLGSPRSTWDVLDESGNVVGFVTSSAYSANYQSNVSFASINAELNQKGRKLRVNIDDNEIRNATLVVKQGKKLEIQ